MGQDLRKMGEDIRVQGGQGSGEMTELVYDPASGEFVTQKKGARVDGDDMVVTDMTEEGFASV